MHFHFKTDFLYNKNTESVPKISRINPQKTLLTRSFSSEVPPAKTTEPQNDN